METGPKHSFSQGIKDIKDYRINYTLMAMDHQKEFKQLFPQVGYLVCNLFMGDRIRCRFLNYSRQTYVPNTLYIAGLHSKGPLEFSIKNSGSGYAIKIHPVIGHHLLKIPMTEVTNHRVRVSDALNICDGLLRRLENHEEITSINNQHLQHFLWKALPDTQRPDLSCGKYHCCPKRKS